MREAIAKLDVSEREILMLREYEQLSYGEIADLMRLPLNTVRSRLFRARMALKDHLDPKRLLQEQMPGGQAGPAHPSGRPRMMMRRDMRENIHPVEQEELMAYLDGELPVERAASTATHLQECRECQILAAELKSISESLTAWEVEPKESEMSADLAKALDEPRKHDAPDSEEGSWLDTWRSRQFVPWAGGALAGALAVLALVFAMIVSLPSQP